MSRQKIRYAVIGGGQISQQAFMPGIGQADNAELVALITGDAKKADALADQCGIQAHTYDDYETLLRSGDIDAVYVATPNFRHTSFVMAALDAGIHVLCEKPLATSVEECEKMIEAQRSSNAKLMTAYRLHCEPGSVDLFTRARRGDFGTLRAFSASFSQNVDERNSRGHNGYWGGPVPDMGAYPLNEARQLFAAEPIAVQAIGTQDPTRGFDFHDTVAVTLLFPENRTAQFTVSYATAAIETFSLIGTQATVHASPCFGFGPELELTYVVDTGEARQTYRFEPVDQFGGEVQYFSDCILNDRQPEPDGEEGLMDVRVLAAIEQALDTGRTIELEPRSRDRYVTSEQTQTLTPAAMPSEDQLVGVITQSA
ncbi:Gfo/Idh/MocA family protein [Salinicola aestuarinus]|uniref:Gfo/Idh/MocA family protein n=1 Tax=Salinicola aestuarinus TaxID=1949082 RepID=UPI000DA17130|nr:Gfo/Idh/MocA family oxidoreductase [Salinicola aestuarinus]